jgi:WD40 repeat protein
LAIAKEDGSVEFWSVDTGARLHSTKLFVRDAWSVDWSRDGRLLLCAGPLPPEVTILDDRGKTVAKIPGPLQPRVAVWSTDGRMFAVTGVYGDIEVWDAKRLQKLRTLQRSADNHVGGLFDAAWSPDGRQLACAGLDLLTINVWDVPSGRHRGSLRGHTGAVHELAWRPDGSVLASSSADSTLRLWDPVKQQQTLLVAEEADPWSPLVWSPSGDLLAFGSKGGDLVITSPPSNRL